MKGNAFHITYVSVNYIVLFMIDSTSTTALASFGLLSIVVLLLLLLVVLPLVLSFVASCFSTSSIRNSVLYVGNVWHNRFHPKKHAFTVSNAPYAT